MTRESSLEVRQSVEVQAPGLVLVRGTASHRAARGDRLVPKPCFPPRQGPCSEGARCRPVSLQRSCAVRLQGGARCGAVPLGRPVCADLLGCGPDCQPAPLCALHLLLSLKDPLFPAVTKIFSHVFLWDLSGFAFTKLSLRPRNWPPRGVGRRHGARCPAQAPRSAAARGSPGLGVFLRPCSFCPGRSQMPG